MAGATLVFIFVDGDSSKTEDKLKMALDGPISFAKATTNKIKMYVLRRDIEEYKNYLVKKSLDPIRIELIAIEDCKSYKPSKDEDRRYLMDALTDFKTKIFNDTREKVTLVDYMKYYLLDEAKNKAESVIIFDSNCKVSDPLEGRQLEVSKMPYDGCTHSGKPYDMWEKLTDQSGGVFVKVQDQLCHLRGLEYFDFIKNCIDCLRREHGTALDVHMMFTSETHDGPANGWYDKYMYKLRQEYSGEFESIIPDNNKCTTLPNCLMHPVREEKGSKEGVMAVKGTIKCSNTFEYQLNTKQGNLLCVRKIMQRTHVTSFRFHWEMEEHLNEIKNIAFYAYCAKNKGAKMNRQEYFRRYIFSQGCVQDVLFELSSMHNRQSRHKPTAAALEAARDYYKLLQQAFNKVDKELREKVIILAIKQYNQGDRILDQTTISNSLSIRRLAYILALVGETATNVLYREEEKELYPGRLGGERPRAFQ